MEPDSSTTAEPKRPKPRWFHITPARLLVVLLAVEGILLLSQHWMPKGYAVLIAITSIGITMVLMLIWWLFALCFHWRFQFSLRSLLVATVAVAIPCSWMAVEMKRAREQREAVEAIRKVGRSVSYDHQYNLPMSNPYATYISGAKPPGPGWLRNILGDDFFATVISVNPSIDIDNNLLFSDVNLECLEAFPQLRWLFVFGTQVTDAGLERLKGLPQLQRLDLGKTKITDRGLECLEGLTQLRQLELACTNVTDAGLEHLKGLSQLQELHLGNTKVTDVGLQHLEGLSQLQSLDLNDTQITDAGLEHLKGLTQLRWIVLGSCDKGLTYKGVEKLKQALPHCYISHFP